MVRPLQTTGVLSLWESRTVLVRLCGRAWEPHLQLPRPRRPRPGVPRPLPRPQKPPKQERICTLTGMALLTMAQRGTQLDEQNVVRLKDGILLRPQKEAPTHVTTQMNPEAVTLSEIRQPQKVTLPTRLTQSTWRRRISKDRKQNVGAAGGRGRGVHA